MGAGGRMVIKKSRGRGGGTEIHSFTERGRTRRDGLKWRAGRTKNKTPPPDKKTKKKKEK